MDPTVPSPAAVTVEMNGTAAELLIKLMAELGTEDSMGVLSRALGMLDQAVAARRGGRRVGVYDPQTQRFMDLVV